MQASLFLCCSRVTMSEFFFDKDHIILSSDLVIFNKVIGNSIFQPERYVARNVM